MDVFNLSALLTLDSDQYEKGLNDAQKQAKGFSSKVKTATKVATGAFAAVGAAVVGTSVALVKGVGNVASYGDNIDKMSQKMGISATAYQEWDAILQHSGTSIEALTRGMTTLSKAAENGDESFAQLGITQEELQTLNQEELFERTIAGLQNMESGTERTVLAQKLLGGSAKELGALLNTSAEDTEAMRQRVHELGGVMSDEAVKASAAYQDSLQDMGTAFSALSRNMLSEFLPSMTSVMDGLTEIFAGDSDKGIALIKEGISGVLENLNEAIPKIGETATNIIGAFSEAIVENIPGIMQYGTDMIVNIVSGIVSALPTLAETAMLIVTSTSTSIMENVLSLVDTGSEMVSNVVSGFAGKIPDMIKTASGMLTSMITLFMGNAPLFLAKGVDIVLNIIKGIGQNVPNIVKAIAGLIADVLATILKNLPEFLKKGAEIVKSIIDGVASMAKDLIGKFPEMAKSAWDEFKGIDWLGLGKAVIDTIVSGIKEVFSNIPDVLKSIGEEAIEIFKSIDWIGLGKAIIGLIKDGIKALFTDVPGALKEIADDGLEKVKNIDWKKLGSDLVSSIGKGITSLSKSTVDLLKDIGEKGHEKIKNIKWLDLGTKLAKNIYSGIKSVKSTIVGLMKETGESGRDKIKNINWNKLGFNLANDIRKGIKDKAGEIKQKMKEIGEQARDKMKNINWNSLGSNIMSGVKSGISDNAYKIIDAAKNAAKRAFEKAKEWLGISSPSKLFRNKIGKMISEGMALGIGDGEGDVVSAIEDMNDEMENIDDPSFMNSDLSTSRSVLNSGGTGGSGTFAPVINVYGAEGQDVNELAEIVMDKITFMYNRERAAYGV